MSGIACDDNCVTEYNRFKMQNSDPKIPVRAFLIFRIVDEQIKLVQEGGENDSWDDFKDALTSDTKDGAYGLFDFKITTDDQRTLQKIVFVAWTPDMGLPIKKKMLYGSSREGFKNSLGSGIAYVIQATDIADLQFEPVAEMVKSGR